MRALFLLLAVLAAACDSTTPTHSIAGDYALISLSGEPLPVDDSWVDRTGHRNVRILVAGELTVLGDGTFTEIRHYAGEYRPFRLLYPGLWTRDGDTYRLNAGAVFVTSGAVVDAAGLEFVHNGRVYRYRRIRS